MSSKLIALAFACTPLLAAAAEDCPAAPAGILKSGVYLQNLDKSVRPQDDFYRHINGGWLAATQIPPDRSNYGTFTKLQDDAERDLRAIVIYSPLSPESDDALMRLAQLEMTRGEDEQAMGHLERVVREHPRSASRPRASFWMARMLFDEGKDAEACRHLADAVANTPAGQVELRNQIEYLMPRCAGMDTSTATSTGNAGASPAPSTPGKAAAGASTAAGAAGASPVPARRAGSSSAPASPAKGATPASASSATTATHASAGAEAAQQFTVQVAAFSNHESAEKLRARLKELGYEARITSGAPPYRVRVGRYATREAADSVAARMKTQHVDGYVTSAEPKP
jgi:tetratricopeptide (TPR) repeat protein